MTKTQKNSSPSAKKTEAAVEDAPPLEQALTELSRRSARAVASLIVRTIAVAVLITILAHEIPGLGGARILLEAVGAALILWPFFTSLGRNYAWRIALGRTYVKAKRWEDADRTLQPFLHPRARLLFDAGGEGIYWLATARQALGRTEEAVRLFTQIAGEGRGKWSDAARVSLENP